ncbi:MAG: hypothetical protein NTV68_01210 [Methanomicrobiales archaeon]|nr:hypothetical protein [Methanomicrobiales archaeon]
MQNLRKPFRTLIKVIMKHQGKIITQIKNSIPLFMEMNQHSKKTVPQIQSEGYDALVNALGPEEIS